ncbi:type II secretion system F family protein [Limimaricola sp. AA108-03]|uniref:type II secretion system F family protein n=1 Tax=Limimaricola sp. AA108-03 TaxID=3425945 RepID=UPI003D777D2B
MPMFSYVAYSDNGQREAGEIDSASEGGAYETLLAMGLSVVELRDAGSPSRTSWLRREIALPRRPLPLGEQALLAEQLALLFSVRLPIPSLLRVLGHGSMRHSTRTRLQRVIWLVSEGLPFAQAFQQVGPPVSPVFRELLGLGEASNAMPELLRDLAELLRRQQKLRAHITSALLYPILLLVSGLALLLLVTMSLAPALAPLFDGEARPMPASLSLLLGLREFLLQWWPALLLAGGAGCVALLAVAVRPTAGRLALRLPLIAPVLRDAALLRLTRGLRLLLRAGLTLPEALEAVAKESDILARPVREAAAALRRGGRAHGAFAEHETGLPTLFVELFRIGEETNRLEEVLETLCSVLATQLERRVQGLLQALTPALTLLVGGSIGGLVFTIMDAVMSINELAF